MVVLGGGAVSYKRGTPVPAGAHATAADPKQTLEGNVWAVADGLPTPEEGALLRPQTDAEGEPVESETSLSPGR